MIYNIVKVINMLKAVKRIPLRPDTFKKLKIYCAENEFKTYDQTINYLLKENKSKK